MSLNSFIKHFIFFPTDTFKVIDIHPNIRGYSEDEEMPEGISESDEVRRDEAIDYIKENMNDDAF